MERRRLWWPVAGGPSTDTWERGYLLAIPSTRENHRFILVVICDKRRGCTVIGVGRLTPIERFIATDGVETSRGMASLVCRHQNSGGS